MKVLLINNYHYRKGGADSVYFNTAKILKQNGHDVYYFSTTSSANIEEQQEDRFARGYDYRMLSIWEKVRAIPSFIYNRDAYNRLLLLLDDIKPDIAHIHLFMGGLSSSILIALKKKKIPVVHTAHDFRLICPAYLFLDGKNEVCEKCIDKLYIRCVLNRCSENSFSQSAMLSLDAYFRKYFVKPAIYIDRFIFVSKFSKQKHVEFDANFSVDTEILYNFNPELTSIIASDIKGKYFLFYGRISREKGINTLIEAAVQAGIQLKVVGTGPMFDQFKELNHDNIEFLGFKSGEELWSLVRNASFIVVPSECYENNPLTIVEAYSFGKPVIGARIGGIPEIIDEGKTGLLFDPRDKLYLENTLRKADTIADLDYRKMSVNARAFAEINFNPDSHYRELIKIYKDCIQNIEI
jgi:glycosyltransferase involved in cell wall biosynthesis